MKPERLQEISDIFDDRYGKAYITFNEHQLIKQLIAAVECREKIIDNLYAVHANIYRELSEAQAELALRKEFIEARKDRASAYHSFWFFERAKGDKNK